MPCPRPTTQASRKPAAVGSKASPQARFWGPALSISPPSDIVLDVARAADPAAMRAAAARLQPAPADGKFDAALAAAGLPRPGAATTLRPQPQIPSQIPPAYRDFEAMVLANLFTSALPKDDGLFGAGSGGDMWKSVFVQEIGKSIAARGGVGIAAALARDPRLTPAAATAATHTGGPDTSAVLATLNAAGIGKAK